jgi:hypothetical protein
MGVGEKKKKKKKPSEIYLLAASFVIYERFLCLKKLSLGRMKDANHIVCLCLDSELKSRVFLGPSSHPHADHAG